MNNTIPKKALVALPDFQNPESGKFRVTTPQEAMIPAFDRSFHFGDSLYEVARTYDGVIFCMDEHIERLKTSARMAMFEKFPRTDFMMNMVRETCRQFFSQFGKADLYVRVMVSRGFGDLNIDPSFSSEPYPLLFVKDLGATPESLYQDGVHFAVVKRRRNHPDALDPAMKSGNYMNNVLAIAEARKMGAVDAIMLNQQGFVTEGTTNNIFMVKDGEVWTSPLSVGILVGITRKWLLQICKDHKLKVQERLFTEQELANADEIFYSSTTKEVVPITTLTGRKIGNGKPGPVTKKLHTEFQKLVQNYINKHRGESLYS